MDLGLAGKVALVTGGSHGVGLATAQALAAEGCKVVICARDPVRLIEAAGTCGAVPVRADALRVGDMLRVLAVTVGAFGTVHILVNNVGGGGRWGTEVVEETDDLVWKDVYAKNAGAAVEFTRAAIPFMRRQKWGRVVTVASIHGVEAGGRPWFTMAKAAEIALMKSLARTPYLARSGITFNTVAPGSIMIEGTGWATEAAGDPSAFAAKLDREYPLGRLGTPEEVAVAIVFLCSERARYINGACLVVDGGESRSF